MQNLPARIGHQKGDFTPSLLSYLILPYVDVDLEVEEHEEHEGEDAEGDEAEPVVRDRVGRVLAEFGHVEAGAEMGKSSLVNIRMMNHFKHSFLPDYADTRPSALH